MNSEKVLQIRMSMKLYKLLKEAAIKDRRSTSSLSRIILEDYIEDKNKQN